MEETKAGFLSRICCWFKAVWESMVARIAETARNMKNLGQEDPRRMIHSVKVGLAIALVSLLYYFDPIYDGFGVSSMWAVITVVVLFEFSVGATIGKAMNRGTATLLGGFLGVGAHRLASCLGVDIVTPVILAVSVFSVAGMVTFVRFFPKVKARYDYGLLIFNLTFCLVCVSGYRDDEVMHVALTRLSTIFVGGCATVLICILVFPVWAGEDLHNLVADNVEKLGNFLQGFEDVYFKASGVLETKALLDQHKPVLSSKAIEDALVASARWEPRHGRFRFRHPWGQYQKIGGLSRELAYRLHSLNGHLNADVKLNPEIRGSFQDACTEMSSECSHALKALASAMRSMTISSSPKAHIVNAKSASNDLKLLLKRNPWQHHDLLQVVPIATVASLIGEIVFCTVRIAEAVHELAYLADFKVSFDTTNVDLGQKGTPRFMRSPSIEASHGVTITVE